ncbi:MAG TPA: mechanosensitive ion channel family protein, partial [Candidatus Binatia bacterium]|nr:mechanosensitive ion channel family protein [Candidatus Binatia bacterium]
MFGNSTETFLPKLDIGVDFAKASLRIALIIGIAYLGLRLLRVAFNRLETLLNRAAAAAEVTPGAATKRVLTLMSVLWTIVVGLVWFVVVLMTLGQLGVNVTPVLAGAGIVGLAIGFGAQNLVKDLVSGFFLILENQVRVGDVAIINGTGGLVEAISFRTIVLRDEAAVVHVFPNGSINTLSNMTKDWSAYVISVNVAYKEDPDRVADVMRRVAEEMYAEPRYRAAMLEPIEIFGVDGFTESAVTIKARLKTQPLQQFAIGREYRRRLKKAFDTAGIEM